MVIIPNVTKEEVDNTSNQNSLTHRDLWYWLDVLKWKQITWFTLAYQNSIIGAAPCHNLIYKHFGCVFILPHISLVHYIDAMFIWPAEQEQQQQSEVENKSTKIQRPETLVKLLQVKGCEARWNIPIPSGPSDS
jgi:hypothetical protein